MQPPVLVNLADFIQRLTDLSAIRCQLEDEENTMASARVKSRGGAYWTKWTAALIPASRLP